jgi:hypothetical protein
MDAFGPAVEGDTWIRVRGWALILSTAMLSNSGEHPWMFFAVGDPADPGRLTLQL